QPALESSPGRPPGNSGESTPHAREGRRDSTGRTTRQQMGDAPAVPIAEKRSRPEQPDDLPGNHRRGKSPRLAMPLGERLVAEGWVTPEQVAAALEANGRIGGFLGETMLEMGLVTAAQLGSVLEEIYGIPYVDLAATTIDPGAVALGPEKLARQKLVLPLRLEHDRLVPAMVDPLDHCAA